MLRSENEGIIDSERRAISSCGIHVHVEITFGAVDGRSFCWASAPKATHRRTMSQLPWKAAQCNLGMAKRMKPVIASQISGRVKTVDSLGLLGAESGSLQLHGS